MKNQILKYAACHMRERELEAKIKVLRDQMHALRQQRGGWHSSGFSGDGRSFQTLANLYSAANCPDARLKPRGDDFCREEKSRVATLVKFFGTRAADKISIADIPAYHAARAAQQKKGVTGNRAVDKETQTLSNIYRYAVAARLYPSNPVAQGRPRYQVESNIRHSYHRAPKSSDACHRICDDLLSRVETESTGWFCLFAMFTGCRSSEPAPPPCGRQKPRNPRLRPMAGQAVRTI